MLIAMNISMKFTTILGQSSKYLSSPLDGASIGREQDILVDGYCQIFSQSFVLWKRFIEFQGVGF